MWRLQVAQLVDSLGEKDKAVVFAASQAFQRLIDIATIKAKTSNRFVTRTGKLRDSIVQENRGPWEQRLKATAPYAPFVENGTGPHTIRARPGGWLVFQVNGATVFRQSVRHPGTKSMPFMEDARDTAASVASVLFEDAIARSLQ